jgi:hypothetical protein
MGKIGDILKGGNPIATLAEGGTKGLVEGIGNVVDKFIQTPDEKAAVMKAIEAEISSRWASDMASKSWLSRNVRPLVLVWAVVIFTILLFFDGNVGGFTVEPAYLPIFQTLLLTIIGGYFALRTIDKRGKAK